MIILSKQLWAEGDVLYATGSTGLNENVLQFLDVDTNADSHSNTTEEIFTNKQFTVPNTVKKRLLVMAFCRASAGANNDATMGFTFRIRMGTAGTTADAEKENISVFNTAVSDGGGAGVYAIGCGGIFLSYYDESTDFSGGDQIVSISGQELGSSGVGGYCDWMLILGA